MRIEPRLSVAQLAEIWPRPIPDLPDFCRRRDEMPTDDTDSGWRPIETAPRDGTWFWAYTSDFEYGRPFNQRLHHRQFGLDVGNLPGVDLILRNPAGLGGLRLDQSVRAALNLASAAGSNQNLAVVGIETGLNRHRSPPRI